MNPWIVAAIGISVVFTALTLIFVALNLFDMLDRSLAQRNEEKTKAKAAAEAAAAPPPAAPQPAAKPKFEGIPPEVVAAISAAVVAAFGRVEVKQIRYRQQAASPHWHMQGRMTHVSSHVKMVDRQRR